MPIPLVVVCSGLPRSGSTWSFSVCRLLLQALCGGENVECGYHEGANADRYVRRIRRSSKAHLIKLHFPTAAMIRFVSEKRARNVYTMRNPLAALSSYREKFGGTIEDIATRMRRSLTAADRWNADGGTLRVEFDDIVNQPRQQILGISKYLGFGGVSEELLESIDHETCLQTVRQRTALIADNPGEWKQFNGSLYDPTTLYHANHAPKADRRAWQDELSDAEQSVARSILGPWVAPYGIQPEGA